MMEYNISAVMPIKGAAIKAGDEELRRDRHRGRQDGRNRCRS
jgi:hypothetical protein